MSAGLPPHLPVPSLADIGIAAFITTRAAGSFGFPEQGDDAEATARWHALQRALAAQGTPRLASARQVHGTRVLVHRDQWDGWVRIDGADAHVLSAGGAAAVTIADCVPVLVGHPSGVVAAVHAGWRGVAGGILPEALRAMMALGLAAAEMVVHLGPSICGRCYEVGPEVYERLTGWPTRHPRHVDLRALLAEQAKELGVRRWTASAECTRCDNDQLFSHRAGDAGRQVAVIVGRAPTVG
ncbi:MAG: polyphenol oxidase family protein [Gemmatimonadaceae bacterium]|nr:polyphenol oxidase family protein [Gemmatimonadaceae bacterium]